MSQWDKLILKLYSLPKEMRYSEVEKILTKLGYVGKESSGGSSHITFRKEGKMPITVPRHGTIKIIFYS